MGLLLCRRARYFVLAQEVTHQKEREGFDLSRSFVLLKPLQEADAEDVAVDNLAVICAAGSVAVRKVRRGRSFRGSRSGHISCLGS